MKKQIHTILCWVLALSLVWLPMSVSADDAMSSMDEHNCHQMGSDMQHQMNNDGTMVDSMREYKNCGNCGDDCGCKDMSACTQRINSAHPCIVSGSLSAHDVLLTLVDVEHVTLYHSQIISPDFRPPVV